MTSLFTFLEKFSIIICKECKVGCPLNEIPTHIQKHHRTIQPQERVTAWQSFQHLPSVVRSQNDLQSFQFPSSTIDPILELGPPIQDGLACQHCRYITRHTQKIQHHYRTEHNWVNPRRRGRPLGGSSAPVPWRTGVHCQRFFPSRFASQWFEVTPRTTQDLPKSYNSQSPDHPLLHAAKEQLQLYSSRTEAIIQAYHDKEQPNLWLRRVRWPHHLAGLNTKAISTTISLDSQEGWSYDDNIALEATLPLQLQHAWDSLGRVLAAAQTSCRPEAAGFAVLFEVNRRSYDKKPRQPFDIALEKRTWDRYLTIWKRILGFILRTQQWDDTGTIQRPAYTFTPLQESSYESVITSLQTLTTQSNSTILAQVDRALLTFLLALFDHNIDQDEYENAAISSLAALGLTVSDDGYNRVVWVEPQDYLVNYSATIKVVRLLIIYQSTLEKGEQEAQSQPVLGLTQPTLFTIVRDKVRRYASAVSEYTTPNPIDWILESRSYGAKVQFSSLGVSEVSWQNDEITYRDIRFTMSELRDFVLNLTIELRRTTARLLFVDIDIEELPSINLTSLIDDPTNQSPGYSFASDSRNQKGELNTWLVRRVIGNPALQSRWVRTSTEASYQAQSQQLNLYRSTTTSYGDDITLFREQFLLILYLISGQPPRTTEILNLRYQNTSYGGVRNLFLSNGLLCTITRYHKGIFRTQSYKAISRFLPREASEHFVRFIQLVLPFWQQVSGITSGADTLSPFFWARDLVYRAKDSRQEWASYDGKPFEQLWSSDQFRALLSQYSVRLLGQRVIPSAWRHIAIAIARRYLKGIFGEVDLHTLRSYDRSDCSESEDKDHPLDLQSTHTTFTSNTTYGLIINQGQSGKAGLADDFRKASLLWHRFLAVSSTIEVGETRKRSYDTFEEQWADARARRLLRLHQVDLLAQLRTMLNDPEASFRGIQQSSLQAIARGVTPILQIDRTSSGKSMSITLPAFCSSEGVSIIVVPLLSLQDDLLDRCRTMKIPTRKWVSSSQPQSNIRAERIIIITPESAITKTFLEFLSRLTVRDELDRIIIDECHTMLDSTSEFRPKMQEVGYILATFGVQLIFLTATLPPDDEDKFFSLVRIPRAEFTIFRNRTTRANIQYVAREVPTVADEDQVAIQEVEQLRTRGVLGRVILYCSAISRGAEIAKQLNCAFYYSKAGSIAEKEQMLRSWRTTGGVIVATNALGLGLDVADVRTVIHVGAPRQLRDYSQESGRGGRDGQPCQAIIFFGRRTTGGRRLTDSSRLVGEYLGGVQCRRTVLDRVMDGFVRAGGCVRKDEAICDVCTRVQASEEQARRQKVEEEKSIVQEKERLVRVRQWMRGLVRGVASKEVADFQALQRGVRFWSGPECVGCWLAGSGVRVRHSVWGECGHDWEGAAEMIEEVRTRVFLEKRLQRFSGCFFCGLPQEICGRWQRTERGGVVGYRAGGGQCTYEGVFEKVLGWCMVIWSRMVREIIEGLGGSYEGREVYGWLGEKVRWAGVETNKGTIVLSIVWRIIEEESN